MRSWEYNRFGVLMGASSLASCPRWPSLRGYSWPMITLFSLQGDFCATALTGLAAAAVSKHTVAYYARYFRHLYTDVFTNGTGPYGDALRRPVIDVYDNFPEKSASMGENRAFNSLKTRELSSVSFPKKPVLGRVCCSS